MQRLRCDIGDFEPAGVSALQEAAARWVAHGKHLCGGATDLTLRCCVRSEGTRSGGVLSHAWGCSLRHLVEASMDLIKHPRLGKPASYLRR